MLEGELGDFTLPDILRLLALTNKTGHLSVRGAAHGGRVELLEGRVRHASASAGRAGLARRLLGMGLLAGDRLVEVLAGEEFLRGDLELGRRLVEAGDVDAGAVTEQVREQTIDAAFDLLRWESGTFAFSATTAEDRRPSLLDLAIPVDELLEEVNRRLEAWPALVERTGADGAIVTITPPGREHVEVALPPDAWLLLGLVDGKRTVADLVRLTGQGAYRTRRTLAALLDERIVTVGSLTGESLVERLVRDHRLLDELEQRHGVPPEAAGIAPSTQPAPEPARVPEPTPAIEPTPAPQAPVAEAPVAEVPAAEEPEPADLTETRRRTAGRLRTDSTLNVTVVDQLIEGVSNL